MDLIESLPFHKSVKKGFNALKEMRIGQTSCGSYVVRFLYPSEITQMNLNDGAFREN